MNKNVLMLREELDGIRLRHIVVAKEAKKIIKEVDETLAKGGFVGDSKDLWPHLVDYACRTMTGSGVVVDLAMSARLMEQLKASRHCNVPGAIKNLEAATEEPLQVF